MGNCCGQSYISNLVTGKIGSGGGTPPEPPATPESFMESLFMYRTPATPVKNSSSYFGNNSSSDLSLTELNKNFRLPFDATLKWATVDVGVTGTIGSAEFIAFQLYKNSTDLYDIGTCQANATLVNCAPASSELAIDLLATDELTVKMIAPNWSTQPTLMLMKITLYFEVTP